jgi:toxin-antitoxin system PIN domain toxin
VTALLDANVLIALVVTDHVHHDAAEAWFVASADRFATCPLTQGSLLRLLLREGQAAGAARAVLAVVSDHPRHEFWPDDACYRDVPVQGVIGPRQVTDAYLAHLARVHRGRLATFDRGLAALHGDVADLVAAGAR